MTVCTRCKATLPDADFYKDRSRRNGLTAQCKSCKRDMERGWAAANPDKVRARQKRYQQNSPELAAAKHRRWREKNPTWSADNNRKWREANPDGSRRWYDANKERVLEAGRRRAARKRGATVGTVDLEAVWRAGGGACPLCGQSIDRELRSPDPLSPSVDHIVPLAKGGTHEQSNLQWTHLVCNKRKGARVPAGPLTEAQGVLP